MILGALTGLVLCLAAPQGVDPGVDSLPADLPTSRYHLTARPWKPLGIPATSYLDRIEEECRFWEHHQDSTGAILDPFIKREWQYATPYFAYAVGTLVSAERAKDLLEKGVLAMDHACTTFASGKTDGHSEFFVPPLTGSLPLFAPFVSAAKIQAWRTQLSAPFRPGGTNNWRTYFMKGQWMRAQAGLINMDAAIGGIESDWSGTQGGRITPTRWNLYHDTSSDPDSLAVEAVGRGNLLALDSLGYSGPSRAAIQTAVRRGTETTLLTQDPTGQAPTNGRTDDHVWVDVGYQVAFETMAEEAQARRDSWRAGQYRHAAELAFQNIDRWLRTDPGWKGSFFVTKNKFDPALRVGYQTASQYSNYNGSILYHTAEAYQTRRSVIPENPAPVEIGGYAFATDSSFGAAFANAGGMAMEVDLRGATGLVYNHYWTALGVVRFGRPGWDTRLGPSDGVRESPSGAGISFAPTWQESGTWLRLASVPDRYRGTFTTTFAHPLLTRCSVIWQPVSGQSGPVFTQHFTITPDGILSQVTQAGTVEGWGMTYPLLENDGATPLAQSLSPEHRIARVTFPRGTDAQNFILLNTAGTAMAADAPLRSSYGSLTPVRATTSDDQHRTFIYPEGAGDPAATAVRDSFRVTVDGFRSVLGRVEGMLYVGRTSAGGVGTGIDLTGGGTPEVMFSASCGFILQLNNGMVTAMETDRAVTATLQGRALKVEAFTPLHF
ncbi:MAG TPA: hypothetical protein VKW04_19350 [Planctomycetota bacterium]|nr:hypothetical protein [Planctomycetota bacterium]